MTERGIWNKRDIVNNLVMKEGQLEDTIMFCFIHARIVVWVIILRHVGRGETSVGKEERRV